MRQKPSVFRNASGPEGRKRPAALSAAGSSLTLSPAPVRRKHRQKKCATGGKVSAHALGNPATHDGHRSRCSRVCSRGAGSRSPAHPALQKSVKQYLCKYSFSYNCAQIELNLILWPCFIFQQIYFYVLSGTCKTACKPAITKPSVFPSAVTVSC